MKISVIGSSIDTEFFILRSLHLKKEDFNFTSPGSGLQPIELPNIIGKIAKKNFEIGWKSIDSPLDIEV